MLVIEWKSGISKGYSDLLPERWFEKDIRSPFVSHEVLGPRGGRSTARCALTVKGKVADLDYAGEHARFNEGRFSVGTLRLIFETADRTTVAHAEWSDGEEAVFKEVDVEWYRRSMPAVEIGTFSPFDLEDGRQQIEQLVTLRQGQPAFRRALMDAYQGRCAITGCAVAEVLEAAHISPYLGDHTNHVTNGLLLRADMHTLFDRGLIKIDRDYQITASADVQAAYDLPKEIRVPEEPGLHPSRDALDIKRGES